MLPAWASWLRNSRPRAFTALTLVAIATVIVSCGDESSEIVFHGVTYGGVSGDLFEISSAALEPIGSVDSTNVSGLQPTVYKLQGVEPAVAVVAADATGSFDLYVAGDVLTGLSSPGATGEPLVRAIPNLCEYWKAPKPAEC